MEGTREVHDIWWTKISSPAEFGIWTNQVEDNRVDELLGRTANLHIIVLILKLENKYWYNLFMV